MEENIAVFFGKKYAKACQIFLWNEYGVFE
jgi:hypothetical protein